MEPTTSTTNSGVDAEDLTQDQVLSTTQPDVDAGGADAGGTDADAEPAEGSDAAASLDFGRNLKRLREAKNWTQARLAAEASNTADGIRDYELGKMRPRSPKLWQLAQALNVMPISLGSSMTRNGVAPQPMDVQLRQKGNRALRLQKLVELLDAGNASEFAQRVQMAVLDFYVLASSDAQLTDLQLEPLLDALPQVRRSWLMSGEGEPLNQASQAAKASPLPAAAEPPAPAPAAAEVADVVPPAAAVTAAPARLPYASETRAITPLVIPQINSGAPLYVPLGGGQVAEVIAVIAGGHSAVSQVRLLAGAGELPVLTTEDQLDILFEALRGVLTHQVGA